MNYFIATDPEPDAVLMKCLLWPCICVVPSCYLCLASMYATTKDVMHNQSDNTRCGRAEFSTRGRGVASFVCRGSWTFKWGSGVRMLLHRGYCLGLCRSLRGACIWILVQCNSAIVCFVLRCCFLLGILGIWSGWAQE